jgi:hypothetical protein
VVADGFSIRPGESWRRDLRVTGEAPYPALKMVLTAGPQTEQVRSRAIQVLYSIDGQAVGFAVRPITVVRDASLLGSTVPQPGDYPVSLSFPTS